jgi:ABC-type transporter Mla maintaining outer membrane lipid asymmetry permease subunit MlaE
MTIGKQPFPGETCGRAWFREDGRRSAMVGSDVTGLTRREFVVGTAAIAFATTVSSGSAANLGYIDCHSHL